MSPYSLKDPQFKFTEYTFIDSKQYGTNPLCHTKILGANTGLYTLYVHYFEMILTRTKMQM